MLPKKGVIYVDPTSNQADTPSTEEAQENDRVASNSASSLTRQDQNLNSQSNQNSNKSQVIEKNSKKKDIYAGIKGKMHDVVQKARVNLDQSDIKESVVAGEKEGVKDIHREEIKSEEQFESIHSTSNIVLYECKSVFPFQLVPDLLSVDLHKVNIITKSFPFIKNIQSIYIDDVSEVDVNTSLIFGSLTIKDKFFADQAHTITHLKISEAMKARRIIQGLIIAVREQIDLSRIDEKELVRKLEDLGQAVGQTRIPVKQ